MKKILILVMSCNQELFIQQEIQLKNKLYAYDILNNKYPNIDFWIYTASEDTKYHVNKQEHKIYVPADDTLGGTFEKTIKTLTLIESLKWDYDFILRTNCSTYINVELLNNFINNVNLDDKSIYTGGIYLTNNYTGPYNWCFYGLGNSLILSKFWVNILVNNSNPKNITNYVVNKEEPYYKIDDNTIGLIINNYAFKNNMDMYDIWKTFKFPYVNTVPNDPYNYIIIPFREYSPDNNRDNEKIISERIHKQIKNYDISKIPVNNILTNDMVHILDFDRKMHSVVKRSWAYEFLDVMSLPKYIKKILINNKNR